ncbi:hypothetical protein [Roseibium aggregatum]|uniref:Uncharacterized protein n=1 Tax=Roseibium aggregatum TaxID=187304 RepID=A0A926NWB7_9HYPH|nr:hypothetical protein [Roseibium aggregatum]MBD1545310.1 hypothetical protein [Roseibium aggregatum]
MQKIALAFATLIFATTVAAAYSLLNDTWFGTEEVAAGVLCKVKDVTVLAATADDCGKIGGEAIHTVTITKTPVN